VKKCGFGSLILVEFGGKGERKEDRIDVGFCICAARTLHPLYVHLGSDLRIDFGEKCRPGL
jgi:hypothetical protein